MKTNAFLRAKLPYGKIHSVAELGQIVRRRRKETGLRQVDAAGLLGVGPRFMGELERGKVTLEIGKVLQALERLGLEIEVVRRGAS